MEWQRDHQHSRLVLQSRLHLLFESTSAVDVTCWHVMVQMLCHSVQAAQRAASCKYSSGRCMLVDILCLVTYGRPHKQRDAHNAGQQCYVCVELLSNYTDALSSTGIISSTHMRRLLVCATYLACCSSVVRQSWFVKRCALLAVIVYVASVLWASLPLGKCMGFVAPTAVLPFSESLCR